MALLIGTRSFNCTSQPQPRMGREAQKILSFLRIVFEPIPGSPATFSNVAVSTGCHEIPWRVVTAFYERLNVVECQVVVGEFSRAVHAAIGIASKNRYTPVVAPF